MKGLEVGKMNIFEMLYPRFYFDKSKPIRLFEAFAGIGCQAMALKRITDNIELVGISEIDKPAIQSYMAIHGQVKNYGDITKMVSIPACDIFTWSFPCTDLSKAGKQKGLNGTRSGLVYEVLRLLQNTKIKPKVLIMENVIDLVQVNFVKPFNEIQLELEQLGYTNYNEVLNAKDYGIPQNRDRVFMVSILSDKENEHYSYAFPMRKEPKLRLKDLLEEEVDEKYFLSEKAIIGMLLTKFQSSKMESRLPNKDGILPTICARDYKAPKLTLVAQLDGFESSGRIYDENGLCPTISTMGGGNRQPKIMIKTWNEDTKAFKTKEADMPRDRLYMQESIGFTITTNSNQQPSILIPEDTIKGYAEAHDGDGIYLDRPYQKRGVVQKGMIQTLKTSGNDIDVVVAAEIRTDEGIRTFADNNMGALRTTGSCGDKVVLLGFIDDSKQEGGEVEYEIFTRNKKAYIKIGKYYFRIRKLTPLECWRLMGISDDDFNKAKAVGMSNSQLYKQAGNGIVVNVFEAILRGMIK